MTSSSSNNAVEDVVALFDAFGSSTYDEGVTLAEHSLQTAAQAAADSAEDVLVAAALLHDVGHMLQAQARGNEQYTDADWNHDAVAADWLRPRFGDAVAEPVGQHVSAKRWLCAREPDYFGTLSAASVASLAAQGGPFTNAEADAWHALPGAEAAIRLRRWDDDGKIVGLRIEPLSAYIDLLRCSSEDEPR